MRLRRFLALSLGVHMTVVALLAPWARPQGHKLEPVKVRIVEARRPEIAREAPAAAVGGAKAPKSTPARSRLTPNPSLKPAPPPTRDGYAALLPGAGHQYSYESDGPGSGEPGGAHGRSFIPTDLRITGDQISGRLDIPLVFRKKNGTSKAVAKIVRTSETAFMFEYVDGDPYMRAVLFEGLRAKDGQEQVFRLFKSMSSDEVLVVLNLNVVQGGNVTGETIEDFAVDGYKLVISKTTILGRSSGFFLPDEEAKRAERRDASHLERLKTSPAFFAPIRNQTP